MEIKFKIERQCRNFEGGEEYTFTPDNDKILYIGGKNRCGKSTLLQVLRSHKDSLEDEKKAKGDGIDDGRVKMAGLEPISVEGFDYDEAFYLDAIVDDPSNLFNAATAYSFVSLGGFAAQHQSKGEKALIELHKLSVRINGYLTKKYGSIDAWKASGKCGLVVLDEVDEGFDTNIQMNWNRILDSKFIQELGLNVICVTHNPICMLSPIKLAEVSVYYMVIGKEISPASYFAIQTGYHINLDPIVKEDYSNVGNQ